MYIQSTKQGVNTMSKIYLSPVMISIIADNCESIEDLKALIKLVKGTAHQYQINWLQGKIEKMKQQVNT